MQSHVQQYTKEQFDLFNYNFISSIAEKNEDFIHNYRIAAKRIHSINKLIKRLPAGKKISQDFNRSGIRQTFKAGAGLREATISISLLKDIRTQLQYNYEAFGEFLLKKITDGEKKLIKNWEYFPHFAFYNYEYEILGLFKKVALGEYEKKFDQFLESRVNKIGRLISQGELHIRLHRARKVIKDIKYGFELNGIRSSDFGANRLTLHRLTLLEDSIGQWHDWFIFYESMKQFTRNNKSFFINTKYRDLFIVTDKKLATLQNRISSSIMKQFRIFEGR